MAFGGGFEDDGEVMSEINMTPLVDVMLVLLIIFIIAMPLLHHSVPVELPRVNNRPVQLLPTIVSLSVTDDGHVHWNEDVLSEDELKQRLTRAAVQTPQPEIHLRGDRQVPYEHVVKVMSAVQKAGLTKLGFVTEPDTSQ